MYYNTSDLREPLAPGEVVDCGLGKQYIIDKHLASGGYSLLYLAHEKGGTRFVALKELFPRNLESAIAHRQTNGKITIQNPLLESGTTDDAMWDELKQCFHKEVLLTQRAGTVYGKDGRKESQNSTDVLHVEGPFASTQGNWYLSIDTFYGESLRSFIERGFVKSCGDIKSNQYVTKLLDILIDVTTKLSALHGNQILLHLDISPDNIYISPSTGGTQLNPYIIDYGSAYDLGNPNEHIEHRYTFNPHSAPEVLALAELQNSNCGYAADYSSDTYSVVSILFYALTGRLFSSELRMFASKWKMQIRDEYSSGREDESQKDSFAETLIQFFEKGLASSQDERFQTTKELHEALLDLKKKYAEYANMLPLVGHDELMSYMVMEKHPLYNYRDNDGNIHVLCIGSGVFVQQMILSMISCGQMANGHLYIHVVSNESDVVIKALLLEKAPALALYSNLSNKTTAEYVTFTFDYVADITDEAVCSEVLNRHCHSRYILISLGSNSANVDTAGLCAKLLAKEGGNRQHTVINYYCAEDVANNTKRNALDGVSHSEIEIDAFGNNLSGYSQTMRMLGMRTLRVAHLYDKLFNPRISLRESAKKLMTDAYNQRSSCASALHLKYKLASVGIDPDCTDISVVINAYYELLSTKKKGKLLELEHRRWMLFMIADGYTCPSLRELKQYGFEMLDGSGTGKFNGSWKCKDRKLHPCLVPCDTNGMQITPEAWERYSTRAQIEASPFDPLDKTSLLLHSLAHDKCLQQQGKIANLFDEIACKIDAMEEDASAEYVNDSEEETSWEIYANVKKQLVSAKDTICTAANQLSYTGTDDQLTALQGACFDLGINIANEVYQLKNALSVFVEYAAFKDYKEPDSAIIDYLPWVLYSGKKYTLIKITSKTIAENMTGPLVLDPTSLIFYGIEQKAEWTAFLRSQGFVDKIEYISNAQTGISESYKAIEDIILQHPGDCVVDVTGANECEVIATQRLTSKYANVAIIRSNENGIVENLHNFSAAPAYLLNRSMSAKEIYSLHGAHEIVTGEGQYMEQLTTLVPSLWKFFQEYKDDWEMVTAFVAHRRTSGAGIWISNVKIDSLTQWREYRRDTVAASHWNILQLTPVFEKLRDSGFIRELSIREVVGKVHISFQFPSGYNDCVFKAFNGFFGLRVPSATTPFTCEVNCNEENGYSIDIKNPCSVACYSKKSDFSDQRNPQSGEEKRFLYTAMEPILRRAEELGLISGLEFTAASETNGTSIKYFYPNTAVKECLLKAGNILELYVWHEARKTDAFDDCAPNFSFRWKEGVENEVDVVLTKGLKSLIISCKTAKFKKEHLYEIKYLTDRFSVNSKPVIIYSSDRAVEDGHLSYNLLPVKNRAKAMGIYLIDLNEIEEGSLGEILIHILNGTVEP